MWRVAAIAAALLGLTAGAADALEVKNVRTTYGPIGAVRTDTRFVQNDVILLFYDIDGLKIEDGGSVRFIVTLEVFDAKKEVIHKKDTPNQQVLALGGTRMAGYATLLLGDQKPGKYQAKVTVADVVDKAKAKASFPYDFSIVETEFAFIHVNMPTYGFLNSEYAGQLVVVGMARDAKK